MTSIKNARCQVCDKTFELDALQQKFVAPLVAKGQSFIMIECPSCGSSTQYVKAEEPVETSHQVRNYRCPITQCAGWVDLIDEKLVLSGVAENAGVSGMKRRTYKKKLQILLRCILIELTATKTER